MIHEIPEIFSNLWAQGPVDLWNVSESKLFVLATSNKAYGDARDSHSMLREFTNDFSKLCGRGPVESW